MFGKISTGIFLMASGTRIINNSAITANVYGRRSARRTIHITFQLLLRRTPRAEGRSSRPDFALGNSKENQNCYVQYDAVCAVGYQRWKWPLDFGDGSAAPKDAATPCY